MTWFVVFANKLFQDGKKISAYGHRFLQPEERKGAEVHLVFSEQVPAADCEKIFRIFNQTVAKYEKAIGWCKVAAIPRTDLMKLRMSELRELVKGR